MRLIDADEFANTFEETDANVCADYGDGFCEFGYSRPLLRLLLSEAPTVYAVEVVRCKDCKWFDPIKRECCGNIVTDNEGGADFTINFEENDFCSFGERRTDEKV